MTLNPLILIYVENIVYFLRLTYVAKSHYQTFLIFYTLDFSRNDESVKNFMNKIFPGHERKSYYVL